MLTSNPITSCNIIVILFYFLFSSARCDDGNAHVKQLFNAGDVCNAPQGSWVPLPDGTKCGDSDCNWPGQWCTINKGDGSSSVMKCADVPVACQQTMGIQNPAAAPSPPPQNLQQIEGNHDRGVRDSKSGDDKGCVDMHELCCFWAQNGECDNNIYFMRVACQKSCGTCGCSVDKADSCTVNVNAGNCKFSSDNGGRFSGGCNQQGGCGNMNQPVMQPQSGCGGQACQQPQPCGNGGGGACGGQQQPQPCGNGGCGGGGGGQQQPCGGGGGCNQPPPCQKGIFPAAGGGCGAKQYGGRQGCGSGCSQNAAVMQPQPSRGVSSQLFNAGGMAQSPSLPTGGCGGSDMMLSCKKISSNQCDQSSMLNQMCPKKCGCRKR